MTQIYKDFYFDAAHFLPLVPEGHKCGRMHGHTYRVRVWCRGPVDSQGMIVDYAAIAAVVQAILDLIDHRVLNEIPGLENPTTELLAPWLLAQIKSGMDQAFRIEVAESATTGCVYEEPYA
jgi:6-pyruvoyltetrahydropterin/6-carboxytetrahydropterin synthase